VTNRSSPAAKLFHILYPSTNFYSIDSVRRQKFEQGAREFEQYLKEQKKEQGQ
jgi:hypothetical protein